MDDDDDDDDERGWRKAKPISRSPLVLITSFQNKMNPNKASKHTFVADPDNSERCWNNVENAVRDLCKRCKAHQIQDDAQILTEGKDANWE